MSYQSIILVILVNSASFLENRHYLTSSAPYDSPPGLPLSRQWWVQLTVAGTMFGDSSAAGYHFGFRFWQSWDSCQNVVFNQAEV